MIRLLGMPSDGLAGAPQLPKRAFLALAALVLEFSGETSRAVLAEFLWPEKPRLQSSANLRKLVASIRQWQTETDVVVFRITRTHLKLDPKRPLTDLDRLLNANILKTERDLRNFLAHCDGELLAHMDVGVENETLLWLYRRREQLEQIWLNLLVGCVDHFASKHLWAALQKLAERRPYDDQLVAARMKHAAALEKWNDVERIYSEYQHTVRSDLCSEPSPSVKIAYAMHLPRQDTSPPSAGHTKRGSARTPDAIPSLIILPPAEQSGSGPTNALVASFVADLTFRLTVSREFSVIAPFSAQLYEQKPALTTRWPAVRYVVSTHVHSHDCGPSFSYLLRDAETQSVLLSTKFNLDETSLERQAARAVRDVSSQIAFREVESHGYRTTPSAYVHYLFGAKLLGSYDLRHIRRARNHFKDALKLVPSYVPARSGLARTLSMEWLILLRAEQDLLVKAKDIAREIIERDPTHSLGYREYAHAEMYLGRHESATIFFGQAIERSPHHADILADMADVCSQNGQIDLARLYIDKALELNPIGPDEYLWVKGSVEFFSDQYSDAYDTLNQMRDKNPVERLMAASAALAGNPEIARSHVNRFRRHYPDYRLDDHASLFPNQAVEQQNKFISALRMAGFE